MSHDARVTLTTVSGQSTSPALSAVWSKGQVRSAVGVARDMMIYAPAALSGTVTVEVAPDYGGDLGWRTLQQDGADVTVTIAKAASIKAAAFGDLRLKSSGAEAADRAFQVVFQEVMDN